MTRKRPRILLIGLDGATFALLDPLMDAGYLPQLSSLKRKAAWGSLASTIPPFTAAAWSTLITGQNPGKHGVISFSTRDRYNYDMTGQGFVSAQRFEHTLWEILSDAGRRVCVINVPLTYPARAVNGYMVTGMLTPPTAKVFTYPPELADRLDPEYVVDVDFIREGNEFALHGLPPKRQMLPTIRQMTIKRAETCQNLFAEEEWDFFMVVFTGTDRIAHYFWDDLETIAGPSLSPIQKELLAYFQELDAAIGQLVQQAGMDAMTMIMSDHGFGSAPHRRLYVNLWLERMGLLWPRASSGLLDLEFWRTRIGRSKRLKEILLRLVPQSTQDAMKATSMSRSIDIIDWNRTQAYFVPIYFHVCGIEINLMGERRQGVVPSGDAYEALCAHIISEARELRDPQTGKKVVKIAARREELFSGRYVSEFPDVMIVLDPRYIGAGSLAGSSVFGPHPRPVRPGEHREDGIFLAIGPNVVPRDSLPSLRLVDVPATILYAMSVPVPSDFDGRVLDQVFDPEFVRQNPVQSQQIQDRPSRQIAETPLYSEREERDLAQRLRGLGYID